MLGEDRSLPMTDLFYLAQKEIYYVGNMEQGSSFIKSRDPHGQKDCRAP